MSAHADATTEATLWTVAVARLILGPSANIQVPPNLNRTDYPTYLMAGINDWGGVSPVTIDYVNPEAPWPHLGQLRAQNREARVSTQTAFADLPGAHCRGWTLYPDRSNAIEIRAHRR